MSGAIKRCKICGKALLFSMPFETICSNCEDLRKAQKNQADASVREVERSEHDANEEWRKIDLKYEVEHDLKLSLKPEMQYVDFWNYSKLYPVLLEWIGTREKRVDLFFGFKKILLKHGVSPEIFYQEPSGMADGVLWKRLHLADGSPGIEFYWDCETPEKKEIQRKADELERRGKERSANRIFFSAVVGLVLLAWLYFR